MDTGEFVFFTVFGGALLLAGLAALLTGEMRVVQRSREKLPALTGSMAWVMAGSYLLWGIFLSLNAVQLFQNRRPTLFESATRTLKWHDDISVAILLGVTFTLVILPAFIVIYQQRGE